MLPFIKSRARHALGPRLTTVLKRWLGRPPPAVRPATEEIGPPVAAPDDPPRKLLFLSDCYAGDVVWAPFHRTMLAYCGFAFDRVLAVRTNDFFHPWTHRPLSQEHLAHVQRQVQSFAPDLVFSINRAGLCEQVLAGAHPSVKTITVFIDYYDRIDDSMHQYGPRDQVWGTGTKRLRAEFLRKYAGRLRPQQAIHTLWGVDHHLFSPSDVPRDTGIIFVGTPFNPEGFVNLVDMISHDEHNRRVFLQTYEAHREQFIYDWPEALQERGFAFDRLKPAERQCFLENFRLQMHVCDQISIENRITCLAALAGLDVKVYSYDNRQWIQDFSIAGARMLKHYQFRPVSDPAELVQLYSSARVGINIQHDHARGHGLSFRVFDLMACKTLLLTHADSKEPLDELGFVEDEDYVSFSDPATLRKKCEFYLEHEERRRTIAESGYQKVRAGHTLAHRFAEVFAGFGYEAQAARFERLARGDIRLLLDAAGILRGRVVTLRSP
jgi:spore maturation protein CgeB